MRPAGGLLPFQRNELEFSATPMSALGQKQTSAPVRVMSALPPKADTVFPRRADENASQGSMFLI